MVARTIKGDWPQLYRSLPFYPHRGEFDKDNDVDKVYSQGYRGDDALRANESIDKWRRVNSLANVNALKETLTKMNRKDIVEQLERRRPKKGMSSRQKARSNWDKLSKFKTTLHKIMELQAAQNQQASEESVITEDTESKQASEPQLDMDKHDSVTSKRKVHFATKSQVLGPIKFPGKTAKGRARLKRNNKGGTGGKMFPLPAIKVTQA